MSSSGRAEIRDGDKDVSPNPSPRDHLASEQGRQQERVGTQGRREQEADHKGREEERVERERGKGSRRRGKEKISGLSTRSYGRRRRVGPQSQCRRSSSRHTEEEEREIE